MNHLIRQYELEDSHTSKPVAAVVGSSVLWIHSFLMFHQGEQVISGKASENLFKNS